MYSTSKIGPSCWTSLSSLRHHLFCSRNESHCSMGEGGLVHNETGVTNIPEIKRWKGFKDFVEQHSGMSEMRLMRAFLQENPFRVEILLNDFEEVFPDFDQNVLIDELLKYWDELPQGIGSISSKKMVVATISVHLPRFVGLTDVTAGRLTHADKDYKSAAEAIAKSVTSFSDIQNKHIEQAVRRSLPLLEHLVGTAYENVADMLIDMNRSVLPPHTFPENLRESIPYNDRRALVTFLSLVPVYQYLQRVKELPYHPFNQDDDVKTLYARFNYHMEVGAFDQVKDMHKELLDIYRSAVEGRMQIVDVGGEGGLSLLPYDDTSQ